MVVDGTSALINTNPSIGGVASAYALAIDGTATTITVTATDPEGLPITYSIASDTSGNIATVSQGTGASTNVFTITPSTNTAYAVHLLLLSVLRTELILRLLQRHLLYNSVYQTLDIQLR